MAGADTRNVALVGHGGAGKTTLGEAILFAAKAVSRQGRVGDGNTVSDFAEDAAGYGYWAVLLVVAGDGVFPVLPGETAIVAAAVLAADGSLSLPLVILAGAAGAVIGDSAAFWVGRAGGGPIKRFITRFAGDDRLEAAERMVQRQGPALVFVGRFLPGIRIAINLSCGAGQMAYPRFLFFDMLGEVVWAARHESARTVEDVLSRRLRALLLDTRASLAVAPRAANLLAGELGRDEEWEAEQVRRFGEIARGYLPP